MFLGGFFLKPFRGFCLRAMPNLDHLGVIFQELLLKSCRCFDAVSRLLLITPHLHIGVDAISHFHIIVRKKRTPILSQACGY